jgi:hypothetical protein
MNPAVILAVSAGQTIHPCPHAYTHFNAGPSKRIGEAFTPREKILLSMLLQPPGVDRLGFPVIRPRGGLPAVVHAQDGHFERGVGGLRQLDECQGELRGAGGLSILRWKADSNAADEARRHRCRRNTRVRPWGSLRVTRRAFPRVTS